MKWISIILLFFLVFKLNAQNEFEVSNKAIIPIKTYNHQIDTLTVYYHQGVMSFGAQRNIFTYYDDGYIKTKINLRESETGWEISGRDTYEYDKMGNYSRITTESYSIDEGWLNLHRFSAKYNDNNQRLERIHQYWRDGNWKNTNEEYTSYDEKGNKIFEINKEYKNDGTFKELKITWKYDDNSNIIEIFREAFNDSVKYFYSTQTLEYNENNQILSISSIIIEENQDTSYYNENNSYDIMGNNTLSIQEKRKNDSIISKIKYLRIFNSDSKITSYIFENWEKGGWKTKDKTEWMYNSNDSIISKTQYTFYDTLVSKSIEKRIFSEEDSLQYYSKEHFLNDSLTKGTKYIYTFDSELNQTTKIYEDYREWTWIPLTKLESTYDHNGNLIIESFYRSYSFDHWSKERKEIITYEDNSSFWKTKLLQEGINNVWVNVTYTTNTNNVDEGISVQNSKAWKDEKWVDNLRYTWHKDDLGNKTYFLSEYWYENEWNGSTRIRTEKNADGYFTFAICESWNGEDWVEDRIKQEFSSFNLPDGSEQLKQLWNSYKVLVSWRKTTSVTDDENLHHHSRNLYIYPNPVSNTATLKYYLEEPAYVSLKIFDQSGRKIREYHNKHQNDGEKDFAINCQSLPQGLYFIVLEIGDNTIIDKFVVQR